MKTRLLLAIVIFCSACTREYSLKGNIADTAKIPADYAFASGYCSGTQLDIPYPVNEDTAATSTTGPLPGAVLLPAPVAGNQGLQSSCSAWAAIYAAGSYAYHLQTNTDYNDTTLLCPSYAYNQITKGNCTCTSITDNLNILKYQGASPIKYMAYNDAGCSNQPDSLQAAKATLFKIRKWAAVKPADTLRIKRLLFEKHILVVSVHGSPAFKQLSAPFIWNEAQPANGEAHAIAVTGYDDSKHSFRIMNSWSSGWADKGFAWMDYTFFTVDTDECFVVY